MKDIIRDTQAESPDELPNVSPEPQPASEIEVAVVASPPDCDDQQEQSKQNGRDNIQRLINEGRWRSIHPDNFPEFGDHQDVLVLHRAAAIRVHWQMLEDERNSVSKQIAVLPSINGSDSDRERLEEVRGALNKQIAEIRDAHLSALEMFTGVGNTDDQAE